MVEIVLSLENFVKSCYNVIFGQLLKQEKKPVISFHNFAAMHALNGCVVWLKLQKYQGENVVTIYVIICFIIYFHNCEFSSILSNFL